VRDCNARIAESRFMRRMSKDVAADHRRRHHSNLISSYRSLQIEFPLPQQDASSDRNPTCHEKKFPFWRARECNLSLIDRLDEFMPSKVVRSRRTDASIALSRGEYEKMRAGHGARSRVAQSR
jgi:hypothetical protein